MTAFLLGLAVAAAWVVFRVLRRSRSTTRRVPTLRLDLPRDPETRYPRAMRGDREAGRP